MESQLTLLINILLSKTSLILPKLSQQPRKEITIPRRARLLAGVLGASPKIVVIPSIASSREVAAMLSYFFMSDASYQFH